ncbi:hypothetical protein [Halorussus sp. MSC15.2]|uniref:hypothetical protein n=1 Tax=Halorussus sp. MSC15.2 TaxID=2283638 RepID=UPI0013D1413A|nr:hypothetical protein [Halorussus sp. MSC15.2]NEU56790.1 hypothetical protein [Halorussus sp. MSC15.2]
MFDTEHAAVTVAVIALAVVAPLAVGTTASVAQDDGSPVGEAFDQSVDVRTDGDESVREQEDGTSVGVQNLSAESVTLRNVTATDVVVRNLTVRRMDQRRNLTFRNVSLRRIVVERARLSNVTVRSATIRSRDLLSEFGVPFARGPNITGQSAQIVRIRNQTLDGAVIGNLTVRNASGLSLSVPAAVTGDAQVNASSPDITVGNASVSAVESVRVSVPNETATTGENATGGVGTTVESA